MRVQLFIVLMSLFLSEAHGQSQYLDSNFNGTGFLQTDYKSTSYDELSNIKLSNNALYAFGRVGIQDYKSYESGFGVLKHNLTSGLSPAFGNQGKANYYFDSYHYAVSTRDVYAYTDGSFLILSDLGLTKIDQNGVLDPNFAFHGKQHFEYGQKTYTRLLVLPNNKIYVFGQKGDDLYIERYNPDGFFDFSFGNQGTLTIDIGSLDIINDAKLLNDGKILITGYSQKQINPSGTSRYNFIRKINQDGTIDPTFNYDDIPPILNPGYFKKMLVDDSNTYAYIINKVSGCDYRVIKVNLQTLVASNVFINTGGGLWLCSNSAVKYVINDIILEGNKIYIAGTRKVDSENSIWVTRYSVDGIIDTTFANQGNFNYFIYTGNPDSPSDSVVNLESIQLAPDGSLYGGGKLNNDFLVFKILKSLTLDVNDSKAVKNNILNVYPNPVKDVLFADNKNLTGTIQVSVYDMSGKLVKKENLDANHDKVSIDLSGLMSGNYVIKYEGKNFSQSVRIIKK
ncbi:T9SS type A sorting domain-containing protein [Chryseobacterium tructae]|uniref:T9SS type A sorting domain-containing protein n=1 Tax=Chryseobacterium tructae TaxID=1037380 RepID=A0ABV7XPZ8_9FLAO|nr:T9SS type A sorting domain-containing protein [Chryseobacterium tructae]MDN3690804.1 T9SS type A sorting domain-containing protein [Chryseobacterium tructae]